MLREAQTTEELSSSINPLSVAFRRQRVSNSKLPSRVGFITRSMPSATLRILFLNRPVFFHNQNVFSLNKRSTLGLQDTSNGQAESHIALMIDFHPAMTIHWKGRSFSKVSHRSHWSFPSRTSHPVKSTERKLKLHCMSGNWTYPTTVFELLGPIWLLLIQYEMDPTVDNQN